MRRFWLILGLIAAAAVIGSGWWYFRPQLAPVGPADLASTVLVAADQPAAIPSNPRLAGLFARADGARLFWDNPEGATILTAAWDGNGALVVSATDAVGWRLFEMDLATRQMTRELSSKVPMLSSADRPTNANAGVFCHSAPNERKALEVWCRDSAWQNPRRLTTHDGREDLVNPTVSPDGSVVAFEVVTLARHNGTPSGPLGWAGSTGTIWRINLDGSGLAQLTRGADDRHPAWSADGRRIYFQRRLPDDGWEIYSMGADGSDPMPVLRTYGADETFPSPIATTGNLAYVSSASGASHRLRRLDVTTKAGEWLTDPDFGPAASVSVSPDGQLAAFLAPVTDSSTSTSPARLGVWILALMGLPVGG